jgi:CheY-like chemotaxis protein
MRILVTGDAEETRRAVATTLHGAGHAVRVAQDERGALAALQQDVPQLVLFTPQEASASALSTLQHMRHGARQASTQLLLVAPPLPEPFAIEAYGVGLDGEIRLPHGPGYLLARVDALQRRLEPSAKAKQAPNGDRAAGAKVAPTAGDASGPVAAIARAATWRSAAECLRVAASKFLALEAAIGELPPPDYGLSLASTILLLNVQHELELRVAVGTNAASGRSLAIHLFGSEGVDLVPDMLGETANIFMGALKTAFGAESLAFTGGLPEMVASELVLRPALTYKLQEAFCLNLVDAKLVVHLGLRSKANLDVALAGLKEGMVLAKDLFNPKGLLMVNAGTRLSATMIDKLRAVLSAKQSVQVMAS